MYSIVHYLDIFILIILVIFLFFFFRKLIGKKVGYTPKNDEKNYSQDFGKNFKLATDLKNKPVHQNEEVKEVNKYPEGSLLYDIDKINQLDKSFDQKIFITSAKKVFELVHQCFANAKLDKVKKLISDDIYNNFVQKAEQRIADGKLLAINIKSFYLSDIVKVDFNDTEVIIKVKFITLQNRILTVADTNEVIKNIEKEVIEFWEFKKDIKVDNKIWKLINISY